LSDEQPAELPTGTVSMLFSDIEGSTALLSRLGPAYVQALTAQRNVLRSAWSAHAGIEMGTEGDSFFVVFSTAPAAVAAAMQAQRELADYPWPEGETVRVRMGVHTGSPVVHDGGYVGMDVHRAARIAGAAHGGQVVLSEVTARLIEAAGLPADVRLKDLGSHQLKDIPQAEHLFQLTIAGLQSEFPALKTLGAGSSLPRPATPLVGRDGELAELTAVLRSPDVRLMTLTGPGGSGKTRLAIGVAQRLTDAFPDGVYFVSLAAATTAEVMWTSIAEVLDVPPEGRIPPGFFLHVAHRSALFVLDNLEQLHGADAVVAELLTQAPQVVVIATSRRPLHVQAEHEHAVPPLELPDDSSLSDAERSGAVQLFVQHACKVKASFRLSSANAADVVALCRRLDGLPLAIELAAARVKLLSPAALLTRLDKALDLSATGNQVLARQKTLRDTIGWSYDLLTPVQQTFFRALGVFAGGADLDAIEAVCSDIDGFVDAFDLVAELVDASLVAVADGPDGEPRVSLLETIRGYARDRLASAGELDKVREKHARHYLGVAEELGPLVSGHQRLEARDRLETEHDNIREALAWALQHEKPADPAGQAPAELRLCIAMNYFWHARGYYSEARRWNGDAVKHAAGSASPELATCLTLLAEHQLILGDHRGARESATRSVDVCRDLTTTNGLLVAALTTLALVEAELGRSSAARWGYQQALTISRDADDNRQLSRLLGGFGLFEAREHNYERAFELFSEARDLAVQLEDPTYSLTNQHNVACTLRQMGQPAQAEQQMRHEIPAFLDHNEPAMLVFLSEDYAAVLAELGDHRRAVELLGAVDAFNERLGTSRSPAQQAEIEAPLAKARAAISVESWDEAYQQGRAKTVEAALAEAHAARQDADPPPLHCG
jgi:predicted ATPase/class 3 adenylate cyclase